MNNSKARIRGIAMLWSLLALSATIMASSVTGSSLNEGPVSWTVCENTGAFTADAEDIKERLSNLSSIVDVKFTPEVLGHINRYLSYKEGLSMIIGRQMAYFPIFEDVLIRKQLPTDLKYLTVIESALKPSATSRVGAAGLWQLMRGTGRMLGLKINREVDERRNPYLSTEAASQYLQMLYEEFDDWTLALAAYNSGPGRVRSAIRRSGSRDYWTLRRFLPKETRNYVPAYIAATYLSTYYYAHEVTPIVEHKDFMSVSNIQIYEKISFKEISEITGTSIETLIAMNPGYLRRYIPESEEGSHLLLPNYAATLLLHHFYRPDTETEYIIPADLDNTLVENLPNGSWREKIKEVPVLPLLSSRALMSRKDENPIIDPKWKAINEEDVIWYKMRKRESLRDVSRKHDIPLSRLISLNADETGHLHQGRMIRLQ